MTVEEARSIALEQPDAIESSHHDHPDFRVGNSIFATLWPTQDRSVLRLPRTFAESLEQQNGELYRIVSRGGGQGWVSVRLPDMEATDFRSLVEIAHGNLGRHEAKAEIQRRGAETERLGGKDLL
jgi:hypothetical protein